MGEWWTVGHGLASVVRLPKDFTRVGGPRRRRVRASRGDRGSGAGAGVDSTGAVARWSASRQDIAGLAGALFADRSGPQPGLDSLNQVESCAPSSSASRRVRNRPTPAGCSPRAAADRPRLVTRRTRRPGSPDHAHERLVILLAERDPNTTRFADHVLATEGPVRTGRIVSRLRPFPPLVPAIGPALLNDGESTMTRSGSTVQTHPCAARSSVDSGGNTTG
jgi:hypothetical protein